MSDEHLFTTRSPILSLEHLESRILLAPVNPGQVALLNPGDQLYFIQGQDADVPSDGPGDPSEAWIIVASYNGPAGSSVQFYDSLGNNTMQNGAKIGDIVVTGSDATSSLLIQRAEFKEGFDLGSVASIVLLDRPDTSDAAFSLTVPSGESGGSATFNTGRLVACASGEDVDYYKFSAQEAERFTVTGAGAGSLEVGIQYGTNAIMWQSTNDYALFDGDSDAAKDDVTVYVKVVTTGSPYTIVIDRRELNFVWSATENNTTAVEDLPNALDSACSLVYVPAAQTGLSGATPEFRLTGQGLVATPNDYFKLSLAPLATIYGTNFTGGPGTNVYIEDASGNVLSNLTFTGQYQNAATTAVDVLIHVVSTANWGFDCRVEPGPLDQMVNLNVDDNGNYIWFDGEPQPWVDNIAGAAVTAPVDSGVAVVTGDIRFTPNCTGFDLIAIDGTLKGSIGTPAQTLGANETIREIMVGYINERGGVYTNGNVGRIIVNTTVSELLESNVDAGADLFPLSLGADFYIGGYLMELQASGTILANMTIGGQGTFTDYVFNYDALAGGNRNLQVWEGMLTSTDGLDYMAADSREAAYIVGSPTGNFTLQGSIWPTVLGPTGYIDSQDWYAFVPGLGQTVNLTTTTWQDVWVYSPSGRLVTYVQPNDPGTFVADEGGAYYILVGDVEAPDDTRVTWLNGGNYNITVTGCQPVALGGIRAGSSIFSHADTTETLEFGDDMTNSDVWVGYNALNNPFPGSANLGFIEVAHQGTYGDIALHTTGDVGYVTAQTMASDDLDYSEWTVGGDLEKVYSRSGDIQFNFMNVGGNLVELYTPGVIGVAEWANPITVQGAVGSVVSGGNFLADLSIGTGGMDLLAVGGDFGSITNYSRVSTAAGANVGYVSIAGTIYDLGDEVEPLTTSRMATFYDDGGAMVYLTPASINKEALGGGTTYTAVPASMTYKYMPVWRIGGGTAGAALAGIVTNDSLTITARGGIVHLPDIELGAYTGTAMTNCYLTVRGSDPLSEVDVYRVESNATSLGAISNYTMNGDILNLQANEVKTIYAHGSIGTGGRFVQTAGRLINPLTGTFAPPTVGYVSEQSDAYFNGVVVAGNIGTVKADGSVGDVYAGGNIGYVYTDGNNVVDSAGFSLRGAAHATRTWDGIAGVVYAGGTIGYIDPGSGIIGGHGGTPIGGVFAGGAIKQFIASGSVISGPVMAAGNIDRFTGTTTVLHDATIGAGASFSDWAMWDSLRLTTQSSTLGYMSLTGAGSGIDESVIQVGVLTTLTLGTGGIGIHDSDIWAMGNPVLQKGIGTITVTGADIDCTNDPAYGGVEGVSNGDIASFQKIGSITVTGVGADIIDTDVRSLVSVDLVSAQGNIVSNGNMTVNAPFFVRTVRANQILGLGNIQFGTGRIDSITTVGDIEANIQVSGQVVTALVGGRLRGDFEVLGSNGSIGTMTVKNVANNAVAVSGDITSSNYIGTLNVTRGDVTGQIQAGGSDTLNNAIGRLVLTNGDLLNDVTVVANPSALRPGGGIGYMSVVGLVAGDITTTSYFSVPRNYAVTANIGTLSVRGDVTGDITVQRNNPADPRDPGGIIKTFTLVGNLNGDMTIEGGIGNMTITGGRIISNGNPTPRIDVTWGNIGTLRLSGYVGGLPVIDDNINVAGDFGGLYVVNGIVGNGVNTGDITVGGTLGVLSISATADLQGQVTAGNIGTATISGPSGVARPITAAGNITTLTVTRPINAAVTAGGSIGTVTAKAGTTANGDITAGAGLTMLNITGNALGDVTLTGGNLGTMIVTNGNLGGDLAVQNGNLNNLQIPNGQVTDNGTPAPRILVNGDVGTMVLKKAGADVLLDEMVVTGYITSATITGNVRRDVTVGSGFLGDGVGTMTISGDVDAELTIDGDVTGTLSIVGGRVTSNLNALDPRIEVTGNLSRYDMHGYTGGQPVVDDEILVDDRLAYFTVRDGNITGTLTAGSMGTIYYNTPAGVLPGADIISNGDLTTLVVSYGPINAPVTVFNYAGTIQALKGVSAGGDITVGASGSPTAGLNQVQVSGGNMLGDVNVITGGLSRLAVTGALQNSAINVAGTLTDVAVTGNYADSNIHANAMTRVRVTGTMSSVLPAEIHAATGSYTLTVGTTTYTISDLIGQTINNVHTFVF